MSKQRENQPFPGKQQGIWQPSLRGMEKPVQSFKSFIRTAPPHPGPLSNKPLPPTPILPPGLPGTKPPSLDSGSSERSASTSLWKAPSEWDEPSTPNSSDQPVTNSSARTYTPIIPEPSPGSIDGEIPNPWPLNRVITQQSCLEPIDEQADWTSLSSSDHLSHLSSSRVLIPESERNSPMPSSNGKVERSLNTRIHPDMYNMTPVSPSDISLRTSNLSTKQKAFASLGIEFPVIEQYPQEQRFGQSIHPQAGDDHQFNSSTNGKGSLLVESESHGLGGISNDDSDMTERLQQLSVSQDYHNVLADQYHESHVHDIPLLTKKVKGGAPKQSHKNGELVPVPLTWRKDPNSASPISPRSKIPEDGKRPLDSRKRYRKLANWVPFHQPMHIHKRSNADEDRSRSASDSAIPVRREIPESEVDRLLRKENSMSGLIPQVRGFASNMKRTMNPDIDMTDKPTLTTHSYPKPSASTSPTLRQTTSLLRLPGGLALVRESPTPSSTPPPPPPSQSSTNLLKISSPIPAPKSSLPTSFPDVNAPPLSRRPSSLYNQPTGTPVAPIKPLSFSTPTQLDRADSPTDPDTHKRIRILDRARDARDAWKRHQRDAKHEKLKQSIRVLGPTDPGVAAAYVRRRGKGGAGEVRVPGYMGIGPL
jgi:hypothetical protein